MTRIICLGTAVLDRVFTVPAIPATPIKVQATGYRERAGGIAATAAVAVAAMGRHVTYWGRLGDDAVATRLIELLRAHGVSELRVKRSPGGKSGTAAVVVDPKGERLLAAFRGAGLDDDPSWLPFDELDRADMLLVDTRWPAASRRALIEARRRRVPSVLDCDLGERELLIELTAAADHTIFAAPGLWRIAGTEDIEAGLRIAQSRTSGLVGVTLGARGACWLDKGALRHQRAFPVAARDTTGAGDTFHGAYAIAIAEKRPIAEAMRFAAACAAIKAERGEGWDGMPDREAVAKLLQGNDA
jgi:sulfofructose kinase